MRRSMVLVAGLVAALVAGTAGPAPASGPGPVAQGATNGEISRYVTAVYQDLFGRDPDVSGLTSWTARLAEGAPRESVANLITSSSEFRSGLIADAYDAYLLRAPDATGLRFWLGRMQATWTISQMEAGFIASDEYWARSGGTAQGWVTALYQDVLERQPAAAELAYWTGRISQGASRGVVATGFLLSTEHLSTVVNGYYRWLLGRDLDPSGQAYWVRILQAGGRDEAIIGGIVASDEYWDLVQGVPRPSSLVVTPASSEVAFGGTVRLSATVYDQYGTSLGDVTDQTSFLIAGDSTQCAVGICHPRDAGRNVVDARYGDVRTQAVVTVRPEGPARYALTEFDGSGGVRDVAPSVTSWSSVATYTDAAFAVRTDGTLWAWGDNHLGVNGPQARLGLGPDSQLEYRTPVQVGTDTDWVSVATSEGVTLAVKADGSLWGWGGAADVLVGLAPGVYDRPTRLVAAGTGWQSVAVGYQVAVGLKTDGSLWTWGLSGQPSLGRGNGADGAVPTRVGAATWTSAEVGFDAVVALRSDGTLWAWGPNGHGMVDLSATPSFVPRQVGAPSDRWTDLAAGAFTGFAVRSDGTLWGWGANSNGEIDRSLDLLAPLGLTRIGTGTTWRTIDAEMSSGGWLHAGTQADGSLWAWGWPSSNAPTMIAEGSWAGARVFRWAGPVVVGLRLVP